MPHPITISKTDYLVYRDCPKNAWLKKHKPDVYYEAELSSFEKLIIDTGNEVDTYAQQLFPTGVAVDGRDIAAEEETQKYLGQKAPTIFQPVFRKENFLAACDILKYDEDTDSYGIYEVKASNEADANLHYYDLAFQVNLLRMCGLNVTSANIVHLNRDYVRKGDVEITKLFAFDDVTEEIEKLCPEVQAEMETAFAYLSQEKEPGGNCVCMIKGRSKHCTTFAYSNPDVPQYSVHDISRIGASKAKLKELIDEKILHVQNVPDGMKLTDVQRNQVDAYKYDKVTIDREGVRDELDQLQFPLYFLDYETFPAAIPRFDGFSPYQQIPFQYSLHILRNPEDTEPEHREFISMGPEDPTPGLVDALHRDIGPTGSVIVWNKMFERGRNEEMGKRIPEAWAHMDSINSRLYDLMDVFKKQYYVHKDFKGSTSIKKVLPVLAPQLSYKSLGIKEGATASESWNKVSTGQTTPEEAARIEHDLKVYCGLDSYAMYAIYKALREL